MADTIPERPQKCPPSDRNAVRHDAGTLSAIRPESCPPWTGTRNQANVVSELAGVLAELMEQGKLPDIEALRGRFAPRVPVMPSVQVVLPAAAVYDELLELA